MQKSPAFLAGVQAGKTAEKSGSTINAIVPPEDYNQEQCSDFVSGFILGSRSQREDELIDDFIKHNEGI